MKLTLGIILLMTNLAHAFEPICSNPNEVTTKDFQAIIKEKNYKGPNQLIIYSVTPPTPIDWSTPGKAFKSIFRNSFIKEGYNIEEEDNEGNKQTRKVNIKTHFIGHMFMELKCNNRPAILTGMSSPGYEEIKGLMIEGKSFTQIISTTKGHFNTAKELQTEIDLRKEKVGNLSYMGINLKDDSCEELLKYLTEFRACGVNNRYGGLDANPHKGEGAGCSAFALSFLQRLNVVPMLDGMDDNQFGAQFKRVVYVPQHLLKSQLKDPEIGAYGLLRGNKIQWAKDKTEGREVKFFDPELFSKWVAEFKNEKAIEGLSYLGRDGNPNVKGVWFEENQTKLEPSTFNLDFLN